MSGFLDIFLNTNNCNITEGHSQQCIKQIELLKKIVKNSNIKNVLEIGFNAGHSAEIFLENNENINLTSFDVGYHDYTLVGKKYIDKTFPNRHTLILGDSLLEVPKYPADKKFDIIFIDGGHAYYVAYGDILNCKKFSHQDTIVIMDDTYFPITNINHTHDPTLAWTDAIKNNIILPISNIVYDNEYPHYRGMSLGKYIIQN
jgi:predicted O-methyltransferase YrrM